MNENDGFGLYIAMLCKLIICALLARGRAVPSELRFGEDRFEWRPTPTSLSIPAAKRLTFRTHAGAITKAFMLVRDAVSNRRLHALELGEQDGILETGITDILNISLRVDQLYTKGNNETSTFWDIVYLLII